ncbi:MAG: response regulator transcription factor [Reyranellaceae bacterium]
MPSADQVAIIDDDESLRLALVGLVRSLGLDGRSYASAEDFLRSGEAKRFAVVVTDIQMPGMSGIELKQHLTSRQCTLPVIMITARPDPSLEDKAMAAGAAAFLRKPFEAKTLIGLLESALGRQL